MFIIYNHLFLEKDVDIWIEGGRRKVELGIRSMLLWQWRLKTSIMQHYNRQTVSYSTYSSTDFAKNWLRNTSSFLQYQVQWTTILKDTYTTAD